MNEHDELCSADSLLPDLPSAAVRKYAGGSQVDFEIDFFRRVLERDPNYIEVLRILGNNLAAKGQHTESLEIDRRIVRLRPKDPVALYNLACSCSMSGEVDSALEWLQSAITAGYNEFEYMKQDGDLEAVRRDPRFLELLASVGVRGPRP